MRKNDKHIEYSIEEKNEIVKVYLTGNFRIVDIVRKYDLGHKSKIYRWVQQYRKHGTCIDNRGKATKEQSPGKGRQKKINVDLNSLTKEDLIERVKLLEDIKKTVAYLKK